ncbi:MAG: hypothetical protein KUG78_16580 [Kangiellaceae bacterium]|nr:hypothetical protein [Kangiellaceae bacterium]
MNSQQDSSNNLTPTQKLLHDSDLAKPQTRSPVISIILKVTLTAFPSIEIKHPSIAAVASWTAKAEYSNGESAW